MIRLKKIHIIIIIFSLILLAFAWTSMTSRESQPLQPPQPWLQNPSTIIGEAKTTDAIKLTSNVTQSIDCLINGEYSINCVKISGNVFVPFTFIKKYFDINGKLGKKNSKEIFQWEHSYSKIYYPRHRYNFRGVFLWFENYNVEARERVKFLSGVYGVPVSSQWDRRGHFYPIQIAQFGLSHFSKNLTTSRPKINLLEDGKLRVTSNWFLSETSSHGRVTSIDDDRLTMKENRIVLINGKATFLMRHKNIWNNDLIISVKIKPLSGCNMTVILATDRATEYTIVYNSSNADLLDGKLIYGFGSESRWYTVTRDVGVDFLKGYAMSKKKLPIKSRYLRINSFVFRGHCLVDDVKIMSNAHEENFRSAVRWMIENQDENGGWPINANRRLSNGALVLKPGWYSAMAQGQAISLLVRMYHFTRENIYLNRAIKALNLFNVNSSDSGVRTYFADKLVWYEEYPTTPSTYVLNGFIYSLFGLYDLKMTCGKHCPMAGYLFDSALISFKQMLPLYDSGSGTLYDLRHFSLKIAPNLARWDYHSTHINQLLYLNTLLNDTQIANTAKRWIGYMKGRRAAHN